MRKEDLIFLKDSFEDYAKRFALPAPEQQRNLALKVEHTHKVREIIAEIAKEESFAANEALIAGAIALLHDIGRFPQYAKWRTFRDSASVNHGELGARILKEKGILRGLPADERELISGAVKYHNALALPDIKDPRLLRFIKLIRDADKLDIWRVLLEHFEAGAAEKASEATLGLPDTPGISEKVLSCLYEGRIALHAHVKNINDLKLLSLSWVYDLNFKASFGMLLERDYIGRLAAKLPGGGKIAGAVSLVRRFAEEKANAS